MLTILNEVSPQHPFEMEGTAVTSILETLLFAQSLITFFFQVCLNMANE